jgi:outer membrane protein TolC
MICKRNICYITLCSVFLAGCSMAPSTSYIAESTKSPLLPEQYQAENVASTEAVKEEVSEKIIDSDGLGQSTNTALLNAINTALVNSHGILKQRAIFAQALQRSIVSDADQGLNLNLNGSSSIKTSNKSNASTTSFDLALNASWQLDIWGELNAQSKAAHYDLAKAKSSLIHAEHTLIADITTAWYQLVYQQKRQQLVLEQQQNTNNQLQAIEYAYRQGLSDIADVYLARANLDSAKSKTSSGTQTLFSTARQLQLLLGQYPNGRLRITGELPYLSNDFELGVPANLLKNRADLNSSWLAVLAQDATAASHYAKQFPSFNLSGALSLSAAKLSDLFSQNLAWNLLANASQAVLDQGKSKANFALARAVLIEREQEYLQVLQNAFSEIESLIQAQTAIAEQWRLNGQILKNSELSLEQISAQYKNGIANYQQVLSLQQQLFDDQNQQLSLHIEKIQNQIELLLALGKPTDINNKSESK